ncbi:hypothetical protein LV779_13875 [Streptomyces thinghirensis]|nr:hypothetical protein [Streptomyces thinghirensis]
MAGEHVSPGGRRMRVLNDQPNAEVVRSAVASMVTAVRIISGDSPVRYIADARNRLGDELRLDVAAADEHGRIREEGVGGRDAAARRRHQGRLSPAHRRRTQGDHRLPQGPHPVFTDGWIGQPQFAHL